MKSASKWFVAGGALLIIICFFLPIITVSGGNISDSINVSLMKIASSPYLFLLYLIPIGALAMMLFSFIPADSQVMKTAFLIGRIAGLVVSLLLLLGALVYFLFVPEKLHPLLMNGASLEGQISIWPGIGLFILLFGIGLSILGILAYFFPEHKTEKVASPEIKQLSTETSKPNDDAKKAYLEAVSGKLSGEKFSLDVDDFSVGRSRDNDLQLSDTRISRLHVRLRYAQGSWFIQDQNSAIGTFVNEKQVKATRLKTGDRIKIGEDVFIFHS